ncbi:MAG: GNAT family N-acetyltransferase [Acidobacteria bacterium]|nr:MAG: GNAT family N-acetyltransferase [Acidobacteriota bacterium]
MLRGSYKRPATHFITMFSSRHHFVDTLPGGFTIRRAVSADAATVAELAERTFAEWFGAQNSPDDIAAHAARSYSEAIQRREIEDPDGVTLLVESDNTPIAFVQIRRGPAPACVDSELPVEIARFYVDRPYHGRGIAQALMSEAIDAARALGGATLWLGVWERNPRAIAFYTKCGFVDRGSHPYVVGSDVQNDRVMVMTL